MDLDDVVNNIGTYATPSLDVLSVELCVCSAESANIRKWWNSKYTSLGMYSVLKDHCTSTVHQSLASSGLDFTGFFPDFYMTPMSFLQDLRSRGKHTCGKNKGKRAKIKYLSGPNSDVMNPITHPSLVTVILA